jgi:hypothetical protein
VTLLTDTSRTDAARLRACIAVLGIGNSQASRSGAEPPLGWGWSKTYQRARDVRNELDLRAREKLRRQLKRKLKRMQINI